MLNETQYQPLPTVSIRLASVINCNTRHAGQIEYLHGLVKHQGWFLGAEKSCREHQSAAYKGSYD